jgi:CRISPR-associated protein Cas2
MRHRYIVAYDVSDAKRLRRTYKKMCGYGQALQYSVFQCALSDREVILMKGDLLRIINQDEDRVMIVDVGPVEGRAALAFEFLGLRRDVPIEGAAVIV